MGGRMCSMHKKLQQVSLLCALTYFFSYERFEKFLGSGRISIFWGKFERVFEGVIYICVCVYIYVNICVILYIYVGITNRKKIGKI